MKKITRREFMEQCPKKLLGLAGVLSIASGVSVRMAKSLLAETPKKYPDVGIVKGENVSQVVEKSIELLGGIKNFIKPGDKVVIKPNIGWNRKPETAANTNPAVIKTIVALCFKAGASNVMVFDRSCASQRISYEMSGIMEAAEEAGAEVKYPDGINSRDYADIKIEKGKYLKSSSIIRELIECDKLINIPVAKQHSSSTLTLGMKNWMGATGDNRGMWHTNLHQSIADFASAMKPALVMVDAINILTAHGPTGGNLADVRKKGVIIVSKDQVAADAYATKLFGMTPNDVGYIKYAAELGIGEINTNKLFVKNISI